MNDPIPGIGLPDNLPDRFRSCLRATSGDMEAALAAQERADADSQAVLRRYHDMLNVSVALARPHEAAATRPDPPRPPLRLARRPGPLPGKTRHRGGRSWRVSGTPLARAGLRA